MAGVFLSSFYISRRAAGFRISTVTFLFDGLGADPLGEVVRDDGLNKMRYTSHGDCYVTDVGYRVASLVHYTPRFQVAVFASAAPVQCDARRLDNKVDDHIDHMCTIEAPDFGEEHRLPQQRVTLTSASVVAPPIAEQKDKEKQRSNA